MTPEQAQRIKQIKNPRLKLAVYRAIIRSALTNNREESKNGKSKSS